MSSISRDASPSTNVTHSTVSIIPRKNKRDVQPDRLSLAKRRLDFDNVDNIPITGDQNALNTRDFIAN